MGKKLIVLLFLCSTFTSAQNQNLFTISSPSSQGLTAKIDKNGNFAIFNLWESDPDYTSLLFSAPIMSSSVGYFVDGNYLNPSSLNTIVPFGPTAGGQVDGIFSAKGLQMENAFFLMDTDASGILKTLGIAVLVSNTSSSPRKVGVKILLDTEIGESQNNPLIYLPNGQKLDQAYRFLTNNIPSYIFSGERASLAQTAEGKGFYIYPYLSSNLPSMLVVGNWKQINTSPWIPQILNPSFVAVDNIIDVGVGIYFGEYTLAPNKSINFGVALSLVKIIVAPPFKNNTLAQAVFTPERYAINESLINALSNAGNFSNKNLTSPLIPGRGIPYTASSNKTEQGDDEPSIEQTIDLRSPEPAWQESLRLEFTMEELKKIYNENIGFGSYDPGYLIMPRNGITNKQN